jgi:S1-C subfamily serine protease
MWRLSSITVALLIIAASSLIWSSPSFSQNACRVADPTGTPLNVRASPNGHVVAKLKNGLIVSILDRSSDGNGKAWVYVGDDKNKKPIGWVYRDFLACDDTQTATTPTCLVMDPSGTPLNVRASPYGRITGTLRNGIFVAVLKSSSDRNGDSWAYVGHAEDGAPIGWVFREFLACGSYDQTHQFYRVNGRAFKYGNEDTFTTPSYEQCQLRCASDASCVALTYFGNIQQCRPMRAAADLLPSPNADSGLKIVRPAAPVSTAPSSTVREPQQPKKEEQVSYGTGFLVNTTGDVLTNYHVVKDCQRVVVSSQSNQYEGASLLAADPANDLAVLKTRLSPSVAPALNVKVRVGDSVFIYGFPLAGLLATTGNFTTGTVTATAGIGDNTSFFQISAPVQPGNSGGPLMDEFGNVIGVVASKLNVLLVARLTNDVPQNINFAIKSTVALNFLDSVGVDTVQQLSQRHLDPANIAELAKQFTVRVSCPH